MKKITESFLNKFYLVILLPVLFTSCKKEDTKPKNISERIEKIVMPSIVSGERVGIAVGTYDNGTTNFYSYGTRDMESGEPIDMETLFEIGSISKTFTATALAKLSIQGDVSLDDKLQDYFDETVKIPTYSNKHIILSQLANHTSSLPREPSNLRTEDHIRFFLDYSMDDFKSFINSYELERETGSLYGYSNIGSGILGYVLKENQNKTYYQLIQDEILIPAGMTNTFIDFNDGDVSNVAQGYIGNSAKSQWLFSEVFEGAGVLKSSMRDMLKYLELQFTTDTDLLSQAVQLSHQKTFDETEENGIGLGWHILNSPELGEIIWHHGGTLSYNSFIGLNKKTGKGVVILINSSSLFSDSTEFLLGKLILSELEK